MAPFLPPPPTASFPVNSTLATPAPLPPHSTRLFDLSQWLCTSSFPELFQFDTFSSAEANDALQAELVATLAAYSGVSTSSVTINSIYDAAAPGSPARVLLQSSSTTLACHSVTTVFLASDVAAGASPSTTLSTLTSSPSSAFSSSTDAPVRVLCEDLVQVAWGDPGFRCMECPVGWEGDGMQCADLDECAASWNGGCDNATECMNLPEGAGHSCSPCPAGYIGTGEAGCVDLNECLLDHGGCDFRTECINTVPGHRCTSCPEGYDSIPAAGDTAGMGVGVGVTCVDVDECTGGPSASGCDPLTACVNVQGGVGCGPCPEGYLGDGYSGCWWPADCSSSPCDPLALCEDGGGTVVCGACPAGYAGTGDTVCTDVDGCSAGPCFEGVACGDVPAPGVGYTCDDCPDGFWGDGKSCLQDLCARAAAPCSSLASCSMLPSGVASCGSCPAGFLGDGITCDDVDECAVSNGLCDAMTHCTNTIGGRECGQCPEGYLGSGYTACKPRTGCSEANGGCWTNGVDSVTCEDDGAELVCGECPSGYTGNGYEGCIDEDGCALPDLCTTACLDVAAPGLGYECAACPAGYLGDGQGEAGALPGKTGCSENQCFSANGGCDLKVACSNAPEAPGGRVCGACPAGYVDVNLDGSVCEDEDGCLRDPCFPGVLCTDLRSPQVGRICGACPPGFQGDGAECADVDECAADTDPPHGGCFRDEASGVVTACANVMWSMEAPKGRVCGPCPEGYKGSGETVCVLVTTCAMSNGGCWAGSGEYAAFSTSCTDLVGNGTECGACPAGFEGSGATGCVDVDECMTDPCFPGAECMRPGQQLDSQSGVRCSDVKAPGEGFLCEYEGAHTTVAWGCPEGYHGDGMTCTPCAMSVQIVDSTVRGGTEKRAGWYRGQRTQIIGELDGLDHPNCTNQEGTLFSWGGAASDGSVLELTAERNKAATLRLSIPKADLRVGLNYQLALSAWLAGNPKVRDVAYLGFYVESQPLLVAFRGGNQVAGAGNLLELSAQDSVDPDGEEGPLGFRWWCTWEGAQDVCRQSDG
ncbi:hypothetical protein CYMTET_33502, partial [Cymbomonas tetramitiformis]